MKTLSLKLITLLALAITLLTPTLAYAKSVHTASWYGGYFHGRKTASGEIYNKYALTAASNSHKLGSKLKVTNVKTGKSVVVKVNDTGAFTKYNRTLDLSQAAFQQIAPLGQGVAKVTIQVLK